jgi:hypothetical protein
MCGRITTNWVESRANDFIKDNCIPEGETLGEYKCDTGMSVEDVTVTVIVNIKTLKGRLITLKFNTGWSGCGEECGNA